VTKTLVATPDPEQRCSYTVRTKGGRTFVCVREPHDWEDNPSMDHRRRAGKVINPDRHVMVRRVDA